MNRRRFLELPILGLPFLLAQNALGQRQPGPAPNRLKLPLVVSTWDSGMTPNRAAWPLLQKGGKAIDAVEAAGRASEGEPSCCVGLEAFPDRDGKVTLDASI
ncbi:MAG: isoaspartyl peptidase/L-asparaginase, partial [Pyrinomonadaceae bacterium]|nr:isoaspartyl peptidase/L-asparaginase [Pyrinomonadaceae bacterium]